MEIGTLMICQECAGRFLVIDTLNIHACPHCKIYSNSKTTFIPFEDYLKESREWY